MAGLLTSTIRIPDLHQLPELVPQYLADLRERLHRGDKATKSTIIKIKFEPNDGESIDQLAWLNHQTARPKIAWYARDGSYSAVAVGSADDDYSTQVNSPAELQKVLNGLTNQHSEYLSYFGGVAFNPYVEPDLEWRPFGAYWFVAPRFYFETESGRQRFVVQAIAPDSIAPVLDGLTDAFQAIRWDHVPPETPAIQVLGRDEFPAHTHWLDIHAQVLNDIGDAKYQKVVLSKNEVLNAAANLTPGSIFHQLVQSNASSYRFYFEPEPNHVFMGASPERLFRREKNTLQSEALAATRPRGESPTETEELGQALMHSEKDRLEHQIVFKQVAHRFQELTDSVQNDQSPRILEQPFVQHLYQHISGTLKTETGLGEILTTLHPTPALGGFPRQASLEAIRQYEDFSRGWFGGPVGWIHGNDAEFAVGIRSALITDTRQMNLYAGVGIVAGSDAESEWLEMEQKLRTIKASLGL